MQHHSSITESTAMAVIAVTTTSGHQEPIQVNVPHHNQFGAAAFYFAEANKSYTTARRYTIDDNGGSYEGL